MSATENDLGGGRTGGARLLLLVSVLVLLVAGAWLWMVIIGRHAGSGSIARTGAGPSLQAGQARATQGRRPVANAPREGGPTSEPGEDPPPDETSPNAPTEDLLPAARVGLARLVQAARGSEEEWQEAIKALGAIARKSPEIARWLLQEISGASDLRLKQGLLLALRGVGDETVRAALVDRVARDPALPIRLAAIEALWRPAVPGFQKDLEPRLPRLAAIAASDAEPVELRVKLLQSLRCRLGDEQVEALILPLIRPGTPPDVQKAAMEDLAIQETPGVRETLMHLAQGDDEVTAESAMSALSFGPPDRQVISLYLRVAKESTNVSLRSYATGEMWRGVIGDYLRSSGAQEEAVTALGSILGRDSEAQVRCEAAFALGRIADSSCLDPLVSAARGDAAGHVRSTAISSLADLALKLPDARERILEVLQQCADSDADPSVAAAARDGVGKVNGECPSAPQGSPR